MNKSALLFIRPAYRMLGAGLLCFFCACQPATVEQATLSDEKLAQIMADLSVADAATNGLSGYAKDSLVQVYFKQVFEVHGASLEIYEKDLRIVAQDLPRMDRLVKQAEALVTEGIAKDPSKK